MISKSILSNYLWSILSLAVSKGLRFAGVVLCIRLVGNHSWGEVASTVALLSFLTFIMDQGLSGSPLLFHLHDRSLDNRLVGLISLYRSVMAVALVAGLFLVDRLVHSLGELVLLYSLVLIPRALAIDWWFHRREYYQITMIMGALRTLVFFSLVAAFVEHGTPAKTVLLIEMAAEAAGVASGYALMRLARADGGGGAPRVGIAELLKFSFPFLLIAVLNNVQIAMDIVLIKLFDGSETVAQYDIGIKIGFLYFFLGGTIIQIIRPKLNRFNRDGRIDRLGDVLQTSSAILLLLGSLLLVPSFYFAEELVGLLFRQESHLSAFVFRWTALWVCITFMTILCSDTLLSLGKRRDYTKAALACAAVNILSNLALLKLFGGYGAIFAKMASEAAFLAYSYSRLPPEVRARLSRPLAFQVAAILAFMGVYLGSELTGLRMTAAGISLAGCLAIGVFGRVFTRKSLAVLREN